jgi:hypothetical protein
VKPLKSICLLLLICGGAVLPRIAEAKCMPGSGPTLATSEASAAPAARVTVKGKYFVGVCNDIRFGPNDTRPFSLPAKRIAIYFVQGDRRQEVARVDADDKKEISAVILIPADAIAGPATIVAEFKAEAGYEVKVRPIAFVVSAQ